MLLIIAQPAWAGWDVSGELGARGEGYAEESTQDPERARGELWLEGELKGGKTVRFFVRGAARVDTAEWYERSLRLDLRERRNQGTALRLDECYAYGRFGDFTVRAGKLIHAWGSADGFNPTDNLNPRDYTDLIRAEKLGVWSLHGYWQRGDFGIDLVVLPLVQASRLPRLDNRFTPPLPSSVENPFYPELGPPELALDVSLADPDYPDLAWETLQEALRLTWKLPGSQVAVVYQRLYSDLPAFSSEIGAPDFELGRVPVEVRSLLYRQEIFGADFQTAIGEYGLRGEAAWIESDSDLAEDYVFSVFGADRRFVDVVGEQDLTLILSVLAQRTQRDAQADPAASALLGVEVPFERGVLLHALWQFNDDLTLDLSAFSAFSDGDYQEALLSWRVADPVKLELKVERVAGPSDSFLGSIEDDSRAFLELRYSF